MNELTPSNIVSRAWDLFKANASDLIVVLFVYAIIKGLLSSLESMTEESFFIISFLTSFINAIISIVLSLGFARALLDVVDGGKAELNTLFKHQDSKLLMHYILGLLLSGIAMVVGILLFIVPGLYLIARLQFFTLVLLEQDEPNFIDALKESWEMTENHVWDLVGIALVAIVIVLAGALALVIGLLAAIPVVGLMSAVVYRMLQSQRLY
jgi:uncharacterized membrane protein